MRVFNLYRESGPNCGGELKTIEAILEQPVIEKPLKHQGLQARAPSPHTSSPVDLLYLVMGSGHWTNAPGKGPRAPACGSQLQPA